jgi:hypothetical protein
MLFSLYAALRARVSNLAARVGSPTGSGLAARWEVSGNTEFNTMISGYISEDLPTPRGAKPQPKKSLSPMLRRGRLLE